MQSITKFALAALALAAPLAAYAEPTPVAATKQARPWALPEREIMVPVEGGNVWVGINGDLAAKAPPVVFVHGGPGGTHLGFGGMTALANERAVIVYDQLDSGKSDHPGDPKNWRVERFVTELEAIRARLGIAKWRVVGHSWGAAVALEYAAAHPDRIASTVLAGTYVSTPQWLMGTRLLILGLPAEVQRDIAACQNPSPPPETNCKAAEQGFYAAYNGRSDHPAPTPEMLAYRNATMGRGSNNTLYRAMWGPSEFTSTGSLKTYDGSPLLAKIDGSRTLFMVGQYDEAELDLVEDYVRLTKGSELAVVPGGSHSFFSERPVENEGLVRGWLARKDTP